MLSSVEWGQGYSSQESWRVYDKGWEDMPVTITLLQVRFHSISIPFQFDLIVIFVTDECRGGVRDGSDGPSARGAGRLVLALLARIGHTDRGTHS